jgi:hypothetical protein
MPEHFADFILQHTSPGVFIISQHLGVRIAIDELILIWEASEDKEWVNRIVELPL